MSNTRGALAIVGMGCRFPKGLDSLGQLWEALKGRFNTSDVVPEDRWTADRYFSSNAASKGKAYIRRGNFLKQDISLFDAAFFGISPRDAENMDPQQRLLLEVVWESFENAGLILPEFAGRQVGVYVGGFMLDHMVTQMSPTNRSQINQNTAAGMMMTMLSNRVSHTFDFRGPSLSIDTACSSSLVAFHYACQDLWRGACELAVVGGSNVMLRPEYPMGMCKGHFLSRDGECKSFDARADGYGRGEGAAAVLLKPLEAAVRDGDPILATVVGTGSNQDGHTPGISMPSGEAQRALVEQVCREYEIDPSEVRYVECHGTGTAIGDPTEAGALGEYYGRARKEKNLSPLVIGSIKSNIGHLEAAAGVAAVVKGVLTLLNRTATPLANLQEPNPAIPFSELGIRLADDMVKLADANEEFNVAVNSFGYGGSNAHAILRSAPLSKQVGSAVASVASGLSANAHAESPKRKSPYYLPLSARSHKAVNAMAGKLADMLRRGARLEDVLYSLSHKRARLSHRAVAIGWDVEEIITALEAIKNETDSNQVVRGVEPYQGIRKPVFVFTGMGPQWWGMGQELYRDEPVYRAAVDEADAVFQEVAGFSALAEMLKTEEQSQVSDTRIAQPANFLIQIGLLAMLRAAGVEPGAVVGHSVGELASGYASGVLNLRDAMAVCFHRSQLQASCAGTGSMMAIGMGKNDALALIAHCADSVSVAAVNGPTNVTLAGDTDELVRLAAKLTEAGTFNKMLDVEVPYHSPMMEPIMGELAARLNRVSPSEPQLPLYSTVTGRAVSGISFGASYWPLNVRQSVEFEAAIYSAIEDGFNTFIEVGPHPVLANSLKDCIKVAGKECRTLYTLRRNTPERSNMRRAVASVFAEGCNIDWSQHIASGKFIQLPNYVWQREKFWMENDRSVQERIAVLENPILGIQEAPATPVWRIDLDHEPVNYLRDHVVTGMPVLPGAAYIEAALELAGIQFPSAKCLVVRDLVIQAPMLIMADRGLDSVTTYDPGSQSVTMRSLENGRLGPGQVHITARIAGHDRCETMSHSLTEVRARFEDSEDIASFYRGLDQMGLSYGPAFQTVRELRLNKSKDQVLARIQMQAELTGNLNSYRIHPTLLDACFQTLSSMLGNSDSTYLPTGIGELCLYVERLPDRIWCVGEKIEQTARYIDCNLTLMDDEGRVVASVRAMRSTAAAKRERTDQFGDRVKRQILNYQWRYGENLTEPKRLGYWLVVGASTGIAQDVAARLEHYGAMVAGKVSFNGVFNQDGNVFTVQPTDSAGIEQVLASCGELDGVVFTHSMDAEDNDDPTGEQALGALATFTQAMLKQNWERKPRVYVATRSAFAVDDRDDEVQPRQAALNGFCRVAFNELEGFQFSTIDLPSRVSLDTVDALTLELLCDDAHDEVALRGGLRLVSELIDSKMLTEDRIEYRNLDDEHPVHVRPLLPDVESVGTARVLTASSRAVEANDVRIRYEATIVPTNLLLDPSSDMIEQPVIEFVGRVLEVGANVEDMRAGMRVCGFAPADLGSHVVADRRALFAVEINEQLSAAELVSSIGPATRAERAFELLDLSAGDSAAIVWSPVAVSFAECLARHGLKVTLLVDDLAELDVRVKQRFETFSCCPVGIAAAMQQRNAGKPFDLLVAGMSDWLKRYDLNLVAHGGSVIDTDESAKPVVLPQHIDTIVRCDMQLLVNKPRRFEATLKRVIDLIEHSAVPVLPSFEVSVADVAWQKLPLADASSAVVMTYETLGKDLPVVLQDDLKFDAAATYLVTGGFGGFGQKTAEWLVHHGARNIVLTGRTGADNAERKAFVQRLEQSGARVLAAACDTSDLQRLSDLFAEISATMPPLKGIFHSGAVIIDQPIAEMDLSTLSKVVQSKALGAWNLHLLSKELSLDHFVLYSSIANLVGNSRQAAYSAANGFLNGLAHYRQSQGLPGTSVNWGAIADVGVVAKDEKLEQFLRYTGLRGIGSMEGLEVLRTALGRGTVQLGVTMITSWADWARFETRGGKSPRFALLIAADSEAKDNTARDALIAEMTKLDPIDQVELLAILMRDIIAAVLKADPESISVDRAIDQLGVDSLMATEIQSTLDAQLGVSISILELIGNSTIRAVAGSALKTLMAGKAEAVPMANVS